MTIKVTIKVSGTVFVKTKNVKRRARQEASDELSPKNVPMISPHPQLKTKYHHQFFPSCPSCRRGEIENPHPGPLPEGEGVEFTRRRVARPESSKGVDNVPDTSSRRVPPALPVFSERAIPPLPKCCGSEKSRIQQP